MENRETLYALEQQRRTVKDATEFVKYLCSPDLFHSLDLSTVKPLEGNGDERNLRIHTTQLIADHMREMTNQALGISLYESGNASSLYPEHDAVPIIAYNAEHDAEHAKQRFEESFMAFHRHEESVKQGLMKHLLPAEPITEQDMKREIITIKYDQSPLNMKILIENYVYVTYIGNKNDPRKHYKFNLLDMQAKTLCFGTQHSKNKFSKNDIRYRGGSHLIFESAVVVETGSTNPVLAAKQLQHTLNIFKYVCGYHNIEVKERKCHNVVATGILNFGLCLELLKERYPYVTYEKVNFAGAIIRISDIDAHAGSQASRISFANSDEFINYEREHNYHNAEDEYNRLYNEKEVTSKSLARDGTTEVYEVNYDEFDLFQASASAASSATSATPSAPHKEKNVTALVFPLGQVICVGNKSREGVIESYTKLFTILERCRNTPENIKLERQLLLAKRNKTKKRKASGSGRRPPADPRESKKKKTTTTSPSLPTKKSVPEPTLEANPNRIVSCRHCDFSESITEYRDVRANVASDKATLCLDCDRCVCHKCYSKLYSKNKLYKRYDESACYDEFTCLQCINVK